MSKKKKDKGATKGKKTPKGKKDPATGVLIGKKPKKGKKGTKEYTDAGLGGWTD